MSLLDENKDNFTSGLPWRAWLMLLCTQKGAHGSDLADALGNTPHAEKLLDQAVADGWIARAYGRPTPTRLQTEFGITGPTTFYYRTVRDSALVAFLDGVAA